MYLYRNWTYIQSLFIGIAYDEIYTFKTPYSRDKLRVIMSLDYGPNFPKPNTGGAGALGARNVQTLFSPLGATWLKMLAVWRSE